ncbi:GNAT family N-acetyltransferase [Pedobacter xixiisoli]|uniref:Ribosomal-protein-alanine N-acetyltransferase n=1 Tax=Pedobacter xixiisoli TaxID=1476464 RepID=A0A286ACW7_9SPHI|nr:GNAT family N-acetyltransferase [Pedobacter xixiisoli]SOD19743.1 ribosomal-protein-alanine N-acetyltransferase [Pedobacter xixiisoli]
MLNLNFNPFPELKTERLLLRQVLPADAESLMKIRGNEEAMRYIPRPRSKTVEDASAMIEVLTSGITEGKSINWAISNIEDPLQIFGMIGYVNFYPEQCKAEIGYMLHPDYWGKGYVPEAILEVEKFGFEQINLEIIEAKIDPRNDNSRKILLRNHYQFDRLVEKEMTFQEEEIDSEYYIKNKQ